MKNKKHLKQSKLKIYTKKGDNCNTYLLSGERVSKVHPRIEAYGSIDELMSFIGLLHSNIKKKEIKSQLLFILNKLMNICCQLANENNNNNLPDISYNDVKKIENFINTLDEKLPVLKNFILPIGNSNVCYAHICRTICRRAERNIVNLAQQHNISKHILSFVNRLSDYFFILARYIAFTNKIKEILWEK